MSPNWRRAPSPTSQAISVQLSGNQGVKHLQLYNSMGSLINEFSVTDSANIDVSNLAGGFYFLQIKESGKAVRFVIH